LYKKVAVESNLTNVDQALQSGGFQTVGLEDSSLNDVSAIVVSGQDKNFLGMQDTSRKIPVINAEGLSAEDVVHQVKNHIS
jgi:hypothetical protein